MKTMKFYVIAGTFLLLTIGNAWAIINHAGERRATSRRALTTNAVGGTAGTAVNVSMAAARTVTCSDENYVPLKLLQMLSEHGRGLTIQSNIQIREK